MTTQERAFVAVPTRVLYEGRAGAAAPGLFGVQLCHRSGAGAAAGGRPEEPAVPRLLAGVPCASRQQGKPEGRRGRDACRLLRAGAARHGQSSAGSGRVPSRSGRAEPPLPPRAPHGDLPAAGAGRWRPTGSSAGQSALGAARGAPPLQPYGPIRAAPAGRGAGLPRPGRRFCVCEGCAVPAPRGRRRLGGPARLGPAGSAERRRRRGGPLPCRSGGPPRRRRGPPEGAAVTAARPPVGPPGFGLPARGEGRAGGR